MEGVKPLNGAAKVNGESVSISGRVEPYYISEVLCKYCTVTSSQSKIDKRMANTYLSNSARLTAVLIVRSSRHACSYSFHIGIKKKTDLKSVCSLEATDIHKHFLLLKEFAQSCLFITYVEPHMTPHFLF